MPRMTTYSKIFFISAPIMLGSAVQNVITFTDRVFMSYQSKDDFAAVGIASVFYLIVAAIGFGFSKGGQIMIARRVGEGQRTEVGRTFYAMLYYEIGLALFMFLVMQFGIEHIFYYFINSDIVLQKAVDYIHYRSWGVFFSYMGVAIIALYTGINRTLFIMFDAFVLAAVNIFLDYNFVFGANGFEEMGIKGVGLASAIAEGSAFAIFVLYIIIEKGNRGYRLFRLPKIDIDLIRRQFRISAPIVLQAIIGLGSWFIFFGLIGNLDTEKHPNALAITNLVQMVYLILSIPIWGFATGINTLVSNFIGMRRRDAVLPIIWKTSKFSLFVTAIIVAVFLTAPHFFLSPLMGEATYDLIDQSIPSFWVVGGVLLIFSVGAIYLNGLTGTGATYFAMKLQFFSAIGYIGYIYFIVYATTGGVPWAWGAEILYWLVIFWVSFRYLQTSRWKKLRV